MPSTESPSERQIQAEELGTSVALGAEKSASVTADQYAGSNSGQLEVQGDVQYPTRLSRSVVAWFGRGHLLLETLSECVFARYQ